MIVVKYWKHFYKNTYKRAYSIWRGGIPVWIYSSLLRTLGSGQLMEAMRTGLTFLTSS